MYKVKSKYYFQISISIFHELYVLSYKYNETLGFIMNLINISLNNSNNFVFLDNIQRRYPLVSVLHPSEEYTSKTCSKCGSQHPTLGRSNTFICPNLNCQQIFDRDVNSGLNILLKTLTETTNVVLKEFSMGNH
jgi:hypothetical protein